MLLFSAAFTLALSYAAGAVLFPKVAVPAVLRFGVGAALISSIEFLFLVFGWGSFPYPAGFVLMAWAIYRRPSLLRERTSAPLDVASRWILLPIFIAYFVFYLVNALAPEIQPDACAYHLALPAEYLRLGHFPARIGFYEMLPQGLEMLFTIAIANGGYSSAKLVHFAFLLATIPLLPLIARRLHFSDLSGYAAAALYFLAPVVGISGSSAYNDAALVFFSLAAFYAVLQEAQPYAWIAGILAGFCFAVKFTGLLIPVLAFAYLLGLRRPVLKFSAGAALMIAPWMLRNFLLTGNPVAPLFNAWFPNPYFSASSDRVLAAALTSYGGFHWYAAPWNWAFGGAFQGVVGPLLFLLPLAVLAWRRPSGKLILFTGTLFLVPVVFNVGTRFLMPALPLLALAVTVTLPRRAIWACVLLQAVLCFPWFLRIWGHHYTWILDDLPWRAALRLETEVHYLETRPGGAYAVARAVETATAPQDRIFSLTSIATAYTTRELLEFWHSTRARQLTEALQLALRPPVADRLRARWSPRQLQALRLVATADSPAELRIYDMTLYDSGASIVSGPAWFAKASPNVWDAARALDGNRATYWSSLAPQRAGMFLEADFDHPQTVDAVEIVAEHKPGFPALVLQGQTLQGQTLGKPAWISLADAFSSAVVQQEDLRHEAGRAIKSAGFTCILAPTGRLGLGPIGDDMLTHQHEWGVELNFRLGGLCLFRLL